jgi:hypothetical protein
MFGQRMARHGRDVGELLEHLGLDDATLVGAPAARSGPMRPVRPTAGHCDHRPNAEDAGDPDWPHGLCGMRQATPQTFFAANGIPATGRGATDEVGARAARR